jgi:putative phage-type endonuclease
MEDKDRADWLEKRRYGVGASEVASLLNLNPYKSVQDVWADKVIGADPLRDSEAMYWGRVLEDPIAQRYEQISGDTVIDPGRTSTQVHRDTSRLFATLDRILDRSGSMGALEIKNTGSSQADKWGTSDAPIYYRIQLQVQMEVFDFDWGVLAALVGGTKLVTPEFSRDIELGQMVVERVEWFWKFVQAGEPPPPQDNAIDVEVAKKLNADTGARISLDDMQRKTYHEWVAVKDQISTLTKAEKNLKTELKSYMGDATFADAGDGYCLKWQTQKRVVRPSTSYPRMFKRVKA